MTYTMRNFIIESTEDLHIVVFGDDSRRPASDVEFELWTEVEILRQLLEEVIANPGLAPGREWRDKYNTITRSIVETE